jgi:hypothetical protein
MDLVYAYGDLQSVPDESVAAASANQGRRNDILAVKAHLDAGRDLWDIAQEEEHFSAVIKFHRGYQLYKHARTDERNFKTTTCVFTGAPGTGKSRAAFNFDQAFVAPLSNGSQWWDGYDPTRHRTVVLDDFHASFPAHQLLRLCDEYPVQVPVKGGFEQFKPEFVVITSNYPPTSWYNWAEVKADINALLRRIDIWWEYFLPETEAHKQLCEDRGFHCLVQCKSAVVWHPMMEELIPLPSKEGELPLYGVPRDEIPTIPLDDFMDHLNGALRPVRVSESDEDDLNYVLEQEVSEGNPEPQPWQDYDDDESQKSHISISSDSSSSSQE